MTEPDPILSTHDLAIGYRDSVVMQHLNLQLHRGRLTALLGCNGIGKSTLLRTIAASQPALGGSVTIDRRNILDIDRRGLARLLSLVYTDRTQAGGLTVEQLVSLGRHPHTGFFGRLDRADRQVVAEAMLATGIAHKSRSAVAELSDGERQKAMIARALAQQTPIILLDEPTAFLDVQSRIEMTLLLHRLTRQQGKAVLLSTHDIAPTLPLADDLWVISHDRRITCGSTDDLVLAGTLDQLFSHGGSVKFDAAAGDFQVQLPTAGEGYQLQCPDPVLRHWITTAMRRNGIATTGHRGTITATSPTLITVHHPGQAPQECASISQLLKIIM